MNHEVTIRTVGEGLVARCTCGWKSTASNTDRGETRIHGKADAHIRKESR